MKRVSRFLAISATAIIVPFSAQAGFEWVAPEKAEQPVYQAPQMPAAAPQIIEPMQAEDLVPPSPTVAPPAMAVPAAPVKREGLFDIHEGFGTDIPLVIAVRQIVPENYTYAFDIDVNMSERVSWNGGEPWIDVLDKTLADQGMKADLNGNAVRISLMSASDMIKTTQTHEPVHMKHVSMASSAPQAVAPAPKTERPVIQHGPQHDTMVPESKSEVVAPEYKSEKKADKFAMFKKAEPVEERTVATAPVPSAPMQEPIDLQRRQKPVYSDHGMDDTGMMSANAQAETIVQPLPIAVPQHDVVPSVSIDGQQFMKYDATKVHYWSAAQGADVKALLTSWSKKVGVTLYWGARSDYELKMPVELHGTYTEAVQAVLETYGEQTPRPWGRFHPNLSDGKSILIVQNYPDY